MVVGLLDLGLNMCQIMGSIVASLVVNNVRNVATDNMKCKQIHAEHFRQVLLTDVNEIKEKLNSMSQSKVLAAFDYVKRGLIVLQGLAPSSEIGNLNSYQITEYYASRGQSMKDLIKEAERFFRQADVWATEAFQDKANVTIPLRLDAIKIQLFCTMLLHWDKPYQWIEIWKMILTNMIKDKGIAQTVLSFNPWLSKNRKREIKVALVDVVRETVSSLWKLAHHDVVVAEQAADLVAYLKRPSFIQEKYHDSWRQTIGLSNSMFFPWNQRLVVIIPECYRICHVPNNRLCVIDRHFKMQVIDSTTLQIIADSESAPFRSDKDYGSVAYDQSKNLLLIIQFDPNDLQTYEYVPNVDVSPSVRVTFVKSVELPEQGYSICCTPIGHWVFRSARGIIYVKWYGTHDWSKIVDNVTVIFDVQDTRDPDGNPGVRLLSDRRIDTYFKNLFKSYDENETSFGYTFYSQTEPFDLVSLFSTKEWCQTVMRFDSGVNEENIVICQKSRIDNWLRLCYVQRNSETDTCILSATTLLPVQFDKLTEQIMINENVIYLATMGTLEKSHDNLLVFL